MRFAAAFLAVLGIGLRDSYGQYSPLWTPLFVAAFLLLFPRCFRDRGEAATGEADKAALAIATLTLIPVGFLVFSMRNWRGAENLWPWVALGKVAAVGLFATLGFRILRRDRKLLQWTPIIALLGVAVLKLALVIAHPAPPIDVFVSNRQAALYFLGGSNPYAMPYEDIYNGRADYPPGFVYWPTVLYVISLAQALFQDIRIALVACDVVLAVVLWRAGEHFRIPRERRFLLVAGWMLFGYQAHLLQQAWVDPILVVATAAALYASERGRLKLAAVALGIAVGAKQYFFPFAGLWSIWCLRSTGFRPARGYVAVAIGLIVSVACFLPFWIADFPAWYQMSVAVPLTQGYRPDSFSLVAFLARRVGLAPSGWVYTVPPFLAALAAAAFLGMRKRATSELALVAFGWFTVTFLCGKQAFGNYYYFAAFFLFWWLFARSGEPRDAAARPKLTLIAENPV